MALDETNTLAPEPETPTIEANAPETETTQEEGPVSLDSPSETETVDTPEDGTETVTEGLLEPEFADVEYDGKTYQVPPELKEAFLRQQDYTRKTQEVAEIRKQAEAYRAEAEQVRSASQEELSARATAFNLDSQLQQYANVDWRALLQEDPIGYQEHRLNFETLQNQRGQVAQYLQTAEQQRSAYAQQDIAKRLQETRTFAEKEIPGWSEEVDNNVTSFAMSELGYDVDTLKTAYSPQIYRTLYLAWLGSQALQRSAAKPAPVAAKPQPLNRITAKSSVPSVKSPENMTMDEYAAWRSKQR